MLDKLQHIATAITEPNFRKVLYTGTWETLYMTISACFIAALIGIPLGVLLYATRKNQFLANAKVNLPLATVVNIGRSIPYIILAISIIPLTRLITGTSIGNTAAIVPLTLSAVPFIARMVEGVLLEVPTGLIETAQAIGAKPIQIVTKVLLPEALPGLINIFTITLITLIGYSAVAGALGAGGLGKIAYSYGHLRYNPPFVVWTIFIIVLLVQCIQFIGDALSRLVNHR